MNERLFFLREQENLTQQELADIFKVSRSLVSKWERYENHIKVKHVEYETAKDNYMKAFQRVTSITCEMKTLETKLKALKDVLASEIKDNILLYSHFNNFCVYIIHFIIFFMA